MKGIEIIPIAEKKTTRRGIKREWINDTITNPEQVVEGYGNRKVAHKKFISGDKEYLLRVDRYWNEENE